MRPLPLGSRGGSWVGTCRFGHEAIMALASREGPCVPQRVSPAPSPRRSSRSRVLRTPKGMRPLGPFQALPQSDSSSRSCSALPGFLTMPPLRPTTRTSSTGDAGSGGGSSRGAHGPAWVLTSPGSERAAQLAKTWRVLGPTSDLLHQKLGGRGWPRPLMHRVTSWLG